MSNTVNMTLEERVTQKLKESDLGTFFSEDDLTDICRKAINTAFFAERRVQEGYHTVIKQPLLVEIAQQACKDAISKKVTELVEDIAKTDQFKQMFADHFSKSISIVAAEAMRAYMGQHSENFLRDAVDHGPLVQLIKNKW